MYVCMYVAREVCLIQMFIQHPYTYMHACIHHIYIHKYILCISKTKCTKVVKSHTHTHTYIRAYIHTRLTVRA